eukprot:PLAT5145.1.p1 GENE.PLAT5145.1~~PLAT5145.1.p1  ORF type:complete len:1038 (+),score=560.56 PLAT5145.1:105-3218(+)
MRRLRSRQPPCRRRRRPDTASAAAGVWLAAARGWLAARRRRYAAGSARAQAGASSAGPGAASHPLRTADGSRTMASGCFSGNHAAVGGMRGGLRGAARQRSPAGLLALAAVVALLACAAPARAEPKIGLLYPLTKHPSGAQRAAAALLALRDFNRGHTDVFPDLPADVISGPPIGSIVSDTEASNSVSLVAALAQVQDAGAVGFLGAAGSSRSKVVQLVADAYNVPQISYSSTAAELSDKSLYPTFFRTCPSDGLQGRLLANMANEFEWDRVAVLYVDNTYGRGIREVFASYVPSNMRVTLRRLPPGGSDEAIMAVLNEVKETLPRLRAFVAATSGDAAVQLMKLAQSAGLTGEGYGWLVADGIMQGSVVERVGEAMRGVVGVAPSVGSADNPVYSAFLNMWRQQQVNDTLFEPLKKNGNTTLKPDDFVNAPNIYSLYSYDATLAMGYAIRSLQARNASVNGTSLISELKRVRFDALVGRIQFDAAGDPLAAYDILSVPGDDKPLRLSTIGSWRSSDADLSFDAPVWAGGSTKPPDAFVPLPEQQLPSYLSPLFWAVAVALSVVSLAVLAFIRTHRHGAVIRLSRPIFCYAIICACLAVLLLSPTIALRPTAGLCALRMWGTQLAFTVVFGCLLSKTYRIHRLFNNPRLRRRRITDRDVWLMVATLLIPDLAMLTAWSAGGIQTNFIEVAQLGVRTYECTIPNWLYIGVGTYKALILTVGVILCTLVRKVSSRMQEGRWIAMCTYILALMGCVLLPLMADGVVVNPTSRVLFLFIVVIVGTTSVLLFIFAPKISEIVNYGTDGRAATMAGKREHRLGSSRSGLLSSRSSSSTGSSGGDDDDSSSPPPGVSSRRSLTKEDAASAAAAATPARSAAGGDGAAGDGAASRRASSQRRRAGSLFSRRRPHRSALDALTRDELKEEEKSLVRRLDKARKEHSTLQGRGLELAVLMDQLENQLNVVQVRIKRKERDPTVSLQMAPLKKDKKKKSDADDAAADSSRETRLRSRSHGGMLKKAGGSVETHNPLHHEERGRADSHF